MPNRGLAELPRRMAISPPRLDQPEAEWPELVDRWLAWVRGLDDKATMLVQVRTRRLPAAALHRLVTELQPLLPDSPLVVSARLDVALAAGAAGLQLPEDGLPADRVRRIAGEELLIGRSVHSVDGVKQAVAGGADWVTLAPVFAPISKPASGRALGLDAVAEAANCGIPVFALGGITADNQAACRQHGAYGVAGISLFDPLAGDV